MAQQILKMFKPFLWLFRISGVAPKKTPVDIYFTATALALILLSVGYAILYWQSRKIDTIQGMISVVCGLMYLSSMISSVITAHFRKELCSSLIKSLMGSEHDLEDKYLKLKVFEILMFCSLSLFALLRAAIGYSSVTNALETVTTSFLIWVAYVLHTTPLIQYSIFVFRLGYRFSALNDRLKAVPQTSSVSILRVELLSVFREHADLRELVADINSYFAFTMTAGIIAKLILIISQSYRFLISISSLVETNQMSFLSMVFAVFMIVVIADTCHTCSIKANETVFIAHRMLTLESPIELMEDVERFSLGLFNNPVRFTAGGVFRLDRGLITKAMAAAVTYLVVAIQLKDGVPPTTWSASVSYNTTDVS